MKLRVVNQSNNKLPHYETIASAGMDIRAYLEDAVTIKPLQRALIPTDYLLTSGRLRSSDKAKKWPCFKHGIGVLNSPGTIDADYRGEIKIILVNLSDQDFEISNGERIAQMVIAQHEKAEWEEVDRLEQTERGEGGFGHTVNKNCL